VSFSEIWWWTFWIDVNVVGEATMLEIGGGVETGGEVWVELVSEVGIAIEIGLEMALIPYKIIEY
jgi:hypothetical protein